MIYMETKINKFKIYKNEIIKKNKMHVLQN